MVKSMMNNLYCFGSPRCTFQTALEEIIKLYDRAGIDEMARDVEVKNILEKYTGLKR